MFDSAAGHIAHLCARNGRLDPVLLDAHQGIEYELALADADLLAARTLMDLRGNISGLDAALGLAFAAEAIPAVIERLDRIHIATERDSGALHAIASDPGLRRLRRATASPDVLSAIGAAVAETTGEIADVALDEPTALARDAFRRFAADVVSPLAQSIHRGDLTVPETLLQPLRKMGVFGLSIPEAYGGSAPADGDSTPMMIAVTEALSEASLAAAGSLITRPEILARALMAGGTEAQKANWLPRIAVGDPLCAIAITEPDHGSDVANLKLRGTRTEGGWLLNGAKTWCTSLARRAC